MDYQNYKLNLKLYSIIELGKQIDAKPEVGITYDNLLSEYTLLLEKQLNQYVKINEQIRPNQSLDFCKIEQLLLSYKEHKPEDRNNLDNILKILDRLLNTLCSSNSLKYQNNYNKSVSYRNAMLPYLKEEKNLNNQLYISYKGFVKSYKDYSQTIVYNKFNGSNKKVVQENGLYEKNFFSNLKIILEKNVLMIIQKKALQDTLTLLEKILERSHNVNEIEASINYQTKKLMKKQPKEDNNLNSIDKEISSIKCQYQNVETIMLLPKIYKMSQQIGVLYCDTYLSKTLVPLLTNFLVMKSQVHINFKYEIFNSLLPV